MVVTLGQQYHVGDEGTTVHLLMTITKLRSDAFGPGYHQLATSTAVYASPCRHLTVGSCCGSGWYNKASRVSPRQTGGYNWLPPKLFTEKYETFVNLHATWAK